MPPSTVDPRVEYHTRLKARRATVAHYDRRDLRLAQTRFGLIVLALVIAVLSLWRGVLSAWWLLLPVAIFAVVAVIHAQVIDKKRHATNAVAYYEHGLARIEDRWMGTGLSTEDFAESTHLYATDLDLFGKGSLFELLCTARTQAGQDTLARWILTPAPRDEILARQESVEELRQRVDLRERLADIGSAEHPSTPVASARTWASAPRVFTNNWPRWMALLSTAFILVALIATLRSGSDSAWRALYASVSEGALAGLFYRTRVKAVLEQAEAPCRALTSLAELLRELEREQLTSGRLATLRAALDRVGLSPTRRIAELDRLRELGELKVFDGAAALLSYWRWRIVVIPFSFLFWLTHLALATESWRTRYGPAIAEWERVAGEFDALAAIAGYAYEHPADPFPEIVEAGPLFDGENLRHPLIPSARSVPNTVCLDRHASLFIVSGSNMSGKSTLLRTVGINAVLAFAGAPVRATRLRLSLLSIGATIRIHDSIQAGTSRFYAEIQRIRRIVALAGDEPHVLFLLDELLHGTNSHDRTIGAAGILRALLRRDAIGLATTHDLALARIADALAPRAGNVHFRDAFTDGHMTFDYAMHPGVVERSNALELMIAAGLDVGETENGPGARADADAGDGKSGSDIQA